MKEIEYRDVEVETIGNRHASSFYYYVCAHTALCYEPHSTMSSCKLRTSFYACVFVRVQVEKIVTEIQYREVRVEIIKEVAAKEREPQVPAPPEVCDGSLQQELCEAELVLPLLQPQLPAKPTGASRSTEVRILYSHTHTVTHTHTSITGPCLCTCRNAQHLRDLVRRRAAGRA